MSELVGRWFSAQASIQSISHSYDPPITHLQIETLSQLSVQNINV